MVIYLCIIYNTAHCYKPNLSKMVVTGQLRRDKAGVFLIYEKISMVKPSKQPYTESCVAYR